MRSVRLFAPVVSAAVLLCACSPDAGAPDTPASPPVTSAASAIATPDPSPQPSSDAPVVITFAAEPEMQPVYQPLIDAFQKDNPGIRVQLLDIETLIRPVVTADGTITSAESSIREILSGADTAAVSPTPEAIAKGWVADLAPLMDADQSFEADDFYPGALDAFGRDGHRYLMPAFQWLDLLAYNKDLWAKSGLPAPTPAWTWQDLKASATQLVQKRSGEIVVYGMLDREGGYRGLIAELADASVQADPATPARLDTPEIAAALDRTTALLHSGTIYAPQGRAGAPDDLRKAILAGRIGSWPASILDSSAKPGFGVGLAPFPGASVGVDGYVMSGGTQHPQEAWRWLAFLSRQPVAWPFGGIQPVPARKSVAEQSGYWRRADPALEAIFKAVMGRQPAQRPPEFDPRAFVLLRRALAQVALGEKNAVQTLRAAQAAYDQQVAQAPPEPTPASDKIAVGPPSVAPPGATTIIFAAPGDGRDPVDQVAHAFNEQSSGVFVEVRHLNFPDGRSPLDELVRQADCFIGNGPPEPDKRAALLDLRPLIDADPTFKLDDYPRALLAPFESASKLYGLPHAVDFRVLNYNQTLFDTAGIAHPTAAWTPQDLALAAQSLTRGAGSAKQYGFASTVLQWRDVLFFLDRAGAVEVTGEGDAARPNFTDPKVVKTVRSYLDLLRAASPHKRLTGYTRGEAIDLEAMALVNAGRVGMWFDFGAFGSNAGRYTGFTHAVAPPPLGAGPLTPDDFRATGLYISAKTQHADACWSWLKTLSADVSVLQGAFPARTSLAASDAFATHAPPGATEVYRAYQQAFERTPEGETQPASQSQIDYYWFFRAIDRALQGANLERELAGAQATTQQFLDCLRGGGRGGDCAKRVDPDYQGWKNAGS